MRYQTDQGQAPLGIMVLKGDLHHIKVTAERFSGLFWVVIENQPIYSITKKRFRQPYRDNYSTHFKRVISTT